MNAAVSWFKNHKSLLFRALVWAWLLTLIMYLVMMLWGVIGPAVPLPVSILVAGFIHVVSLAGDLLLSALCDTSDMLPKNPLLIAATFIANTIVAVIVAWICSMLRGKKNP